MVIDRIILIFMVMSVGKMISQQFLLGLPISEHFLDGVDARHDGSMLSWLSDEPLDDGHLLLDEIVYIGCTHFI